MEVGAPPKKVSNSALFLQEIEEISFSYVFYITTISFEMSFIVLILSLIIKLQQILLQIFLEYHHEIG